ncbi:hypothetical protein ANN_20146 [Periplaneta americana]|uniref:Uncharacterized protein n=1 Tax=Periplaneta americana TaxID=6978 RepID=A0ABQ8SBU0_PERAM|nr:hypothetical protein ANN_20146 [Periplaneta americana]
MPWTGEERAYAVVSFLVRGNSVVAAQMFLGRLIPSRGDGPWPARSPDLASCDFFPWGQLKAETYRNAVQPFPEIWKSNRRHVRLESRPSEVLESNMPGRYELLSVTQANIKHRLNDAFSVGELSTGPGLPGSHDGSALRKLFSENKYSRLGSAVHRTSPPGPVTKTAVEVRYRLCTNEVDVIGYTSNQSDTDDHSSVQSTSSDSGVAMSTSRLTLSEMEII